MHAIKRWARRAAGAALATVLALVLCVLGAAAFLGTESGRDAAARLAERALSDESAKVRIARVDGALMSDFSIGRVSVTDRAGNTILIEDTRVVWRPISLLRGTLDIRTLRSRRVATEGFAAAPDSGSEPATLPPISIRVAEAAVEEIALGAAVLGAPQRLSLNASAALDSSLGHVRLDARLARIDGAPGHADIELDYTADPARLAARLDIEEPAGGLVGRLAGLPPGTPLSAKLDGAGPPDRWRGRLAAQAGSLADLQADVVLAVGQAGLLLSLDGDASLAALLPQAARPFATPRIDLRAALAYGPDGGLSLTALEANSAALSVTAQGRYAPSNDAVKGSLTAVLRDAAALAAVAPGLVLDEARLDTTFGGTLARPLLGGRIVARGLSVETLKAASLDGELRLVPASGDASALSGALRFDGIEASAMLPDGLLGPALALRVDADIRPNGSIPRLGLKAESGTVSAEIDGALDADGRLEGRYALRHDGIAGAARAAGVPLRAAALHAAGGLGADLAGGDVRLGIAGSLDGIAADAPWASALLGSRVALAGELRWNDAHGLTLTGLDARSDAARVQGDAAFHADSGRIDGHYEITMASLGPLSPLAGAPLAGSVSATGTVAGTVAALRASGQVAIRDLAVQDLAVGTVTAELDARQADSGLTAALRLGGAVGGRTLGGTAELAFEGGNVRLPRIELSVGRNRVSGELAIAGGGTRATGMLTLILADLADLPPIGGPPPFAAGSGTVRMHLRDREAQEIAIDADAAGIAAAGGAASAGRMTADIVLRDPFGAARAEGRIDIADLKVQDVAIDSVQLTASGTPAALDWTAAAAAERPEPLSLSAGGRLTLDGERGTATVTRLEGTAAAHRIALRSPASIAWSPGGVKGGPVDLSVGGGDLRLTAAYEADRIDAAGEATGLPVALAVLFDPRIEFAGTLSGTMRVSGAPARPLVEMSLTGSDIRPLDLAREDFSGLRVTADLRQGPDELRLRVAAHGGQDISATAELRTAAALSLQPFRLTPPPNAPLAGRMEAAGTLGLVERLLGLGGDRLAGRIAAKADLSGSVAKPELRGDASLTGGAYEDTASGIVVRDAAARLEFAGSEARLVALSAHDGDGGRITGSGTFALGGQAAGTGGVSLVLDRFAALRRPEADIVASGTLTVTGPVHAAAIRGKLTVERGELRIPDRLPPGVVELDVIEINGPEAELPPADRTEPAMSPTVPVALDVSVGFPGRTFLRGRGLDSEWEGALRIAGTAAAPAIAGTLSVVRGTFAFAGKTFELKSGRVTFDGSEPVEPEIGAMAEVRLESVLARVEITGKATAPVLAISSEPPLPQEDVLAQILFGQSTGQLSAIQAARLAQTAATLSGTGSGINIVDRVRQRLGVDVLDVGEAESGSGATLKAGKYLTEDVFISVTQGTEPGSQKVGVEVEILPNLSVESDISGEASSNIGVNWKFDY